MSIPRYVIWVILLIGLQVEVSIFSLDSDTISIRYLSINHYIQAFPHHFLVLRSRGINPSFVEHLSPIKGISTSYGYHPSKRMRPVMVEKEPANQSNFKDPVGAGADSVSCTFPHPILSQQVHFWLQLANEIMFDLQFLLDDEQPMAAAGPESLGLKPMTRSLLDPDDPKRLLRIS